jgi:hypothetical protein
MTIVMARHAAAGFLGLLHWPRSTHGLAENQAIDERTELPPTCLARGRVVRGDVARDSCLTCGDLFGSHSRLSDRSRRQQSNHVDDASEVRG